MKVDIPKSVIIKMIKSRLIHPSEVGCLDYESKVLIKKICIEMCKPKNCLVCTSSNLCADKMVDSLSESNWFTKIENQSITSKC